MHSGVCYGTIDVLCAVAVDMVLLMQWWFVAQILVGLNNKAIEKPSLKKQKKRL